MAIALAPAGAGVGALDLLELYATYCRDDGFDVDEAEFRAFRRLRAERAVPRDFYVAAHGLPAWELEAQQIDGGHLRRIGAILAHLSGPAVSQRASEQRNLPGVIGVVLHDTVERRIDRHAATQRPVAGLTNPLCQPPVVERRRRAHELGIGDIELGQDCLPVAVRAHRRHWPVMARSPAWVPEAFRTDERL